MLSMRCGNKKNGIKGDAGGYVMRVELVVVVVKGDGVVMIVMW